MFNINLTGWLAKKLYEKQEHSCSSNPAIEIPFLSLGSKTNSFAMRFNKNEVGRDFFVGDLHGCYRDLEAALSAVNFDKAKDVLYSVGDLIDKGHDSFKCLQLLKEPWFRSVRGNHEADAYRQFNHEAACAGKLGYWLSNGGPWDTAFTNEEIAEANQLILAASTLPLIILVEDIAVIHAEFFGNIQNCATSHKVEEFGLYGRSRYRTNDTSLVDGVAALVCGHTRVREVTAIGNTVYIDTGAGRSNGKLTLITYEEILTQLF